MSRCSLYNLGAQHLRLLPVTTAAVLGPCISGRISSWIWSGRRKQCFVYRLPTGSPSGWTPGMAWLFLPLHSVAYWRAHWRPVKWSKRFISREINVCITKYFRFVLVYYKFVNNTYCNIITQRLLPPSSTTNRFAHGTVQRARWYCSDRKLVVPVVRTFPCFFVCCSYTVRTIGLKSYILCEK